MTNSTASMDLMNRNCPVCSSSDNSRLFAESNYDERKLNDFSFASRKVPELMHFRLLLCSTCGILYASPAPAPESLASSYRDASYDSGEEARYAARTYFRHASDFLQQLPDRKGALDIGAGDGAFLAELLHARFSEVVGIEPSLSPVMAASPEVRGLIRQEPFSGERFAKSSFSLITCFQTLEHVPDPLEICRSARRLLKPGGAFFTVVHNYRSFSAKILGMRSPIYDIEHLQLFSPAGIKRLLEQAGFGHIRSFPIMNKYPLHYWLKLLPIGTSARERIGRVLGAVNVRHIAIPLPAGNVAAVGFNLGQTDQANSMHHADNQEKGK